MQLISRATTLDQWQDTPGFIHLQHVDGGLAKHNVGCHSTEAGNNELRVAIRHVAYTDRELEPICTITAKI
jgi:hypothetical protein